MTEITPVTPTVTPPATPAGGQTPVEPAKEPEKKTLTQAEIDSIVEERLARDRKAREEKLAADLGMPLKEAKALIQAKKDAAEKEKTDLQKAIEKNETLENVIKDRDLKDLKRTKIESLIAGKKIKLPDGTTIADVLDMVTGEDEGGIEKGCERLLKFFPFIAPGMPGLNPANPGGKPPDLAEQIKAAQADGLKTGNWGLYNKLTLQKG